MVDKLSVSLDGVEMGDDNELPTEIVWSIMKGIGQDASEYDTGDKLKKKLAQAYQVVAGTAPINASGSAAACVAVY